MRKIVISLIIFSLLFSPLLAGGLAENPNVIQMPWNRVSKTTGDASSNSEKTTQILLPTLEKDLVISVTPEDLQKTSKTNSEGEPVETVPYTDEEIKAVMETVAELQDEIQQGEKNLSNIVVESAKDKILIEELDKENSNLQEGFSNLLEENNNYKAENEALKTENADFKAKLKKDYFKVRFGANCDYKPLSQFNVGVFTGFRIGDLTADVGVKVDLNDTIANPTSLLSFDSYTLTASVAYEF